MSILCKSAWVACNWLERRAGSLPVGSRCSLEPVRPKTAGSSWGMRHLCWESNGCFEEQGAVFL